MTLRRLLLLMVALTAVAALLAGMADAKRPRPPAPKHARMENTGHRKHAAKAPVHRTFSLEQDEGNENPGVLKSVPYPLQTASSGGLATFSSARYGDMWGGPEKATMATAFGAIAGGAVGAFNGKRKDEKDAARSDREGLYKMSKDEFANKVGNHQALAPNQLASAFGLTDARASELLNNVLNDGYGGENDEISTSDLFDYLTRNINDRKLTEFVLADSVFSESGSNRATIARDWIRGKTVSTQTGESTRAQRPRKETATSTAAEKAEEAEEARVESQGKAVRMHTRESTRAQRSSKETATSTAAEKAEEAEKARVESQGNAVSTQTWESTRAQRPRKETATSTETNKALVAEKARSESQGKAVRMHTRESTRAQRSSKEAATAEAVKKSLIAVEKDDFMKYWSDNVDEVDLSKLSNTIDKALGGHQFANAGQYGRALDEIKRSPNHGKAVSPQEFWKWLTHDEDTVYLDISRRIVIRKSLVGEYMKNNPKASQPRKRVATRKRRRKTEKQQQRDEA